MMGTYCEAGEDVSSCAHSNAYYTVDPAETQWVTEKLEMNTLLLI